MRKKWINGWEDAMKITIRIEGGGVYSTALKGTFRVAKDWGSLEWSLLCVSIMKKAPKAK